MKIKSTLLIIYCLLIVSICKAQTFTLYGDKTFGGNRSESRPYIRNSGNNTFVLAGTSDSYLNQDVTDATCDSGKRDIWLLKMDTGNNIVWNYCFGAIGAEDFPWFIQTSNNQFLFTCNHRADSSCDKTEHYRGYPAPSGTFNYDYWICLVDSDGTKLWDKTLGTNDADYRPEAVQLTTGEFLICGQAYDTINNDKTVPNYGWEDYWAIKLDAAGNKIWDKVYGGSGSEFVDQGGSIRGFDLLAIEEGGFVIAGTTESPASGLVTDTSRGQMDFWIIKCDSAGNRVWDRRYGGNKLDRCSRIIATQEGEYIVCGTTNSFQGLDVSQSGFGGSDAWVIKLDSLGHKQWDKRYGGFGNEIAGWIEEAPGGGYWIGGKTNSDSSYDVSENGYGAFDYWMLKIDSAGNKLWDKRFGGPGFEDLFNFIIMPDSSIYICGDAQPGTSAVKTDPGKGTFDYWVVHFKYTDPVIIGINESLFIIPQLSVTPNPVKDNCTVTCAVNNAILTLYDITGRALLHQAFTGITQVDISNLANGVYIAEVKDKQGRNVKAKLVKE